MKNLLSLIAIAISTCAFSQSFHYDQVKELDIKQLSEKISNEDLLSKEEKKTLNACITKEGFEFNKNNYYECIKSSMDQKQARTLMSLYPIKNSTRDNATTPILKKDAIRTTEEIHPKK
jgi:hypothetical protein